MARFQWANGNLGFFTYDRLTDYVQSDFSATGMGLDLALPAGGQVYAAHIEMTFANVVTYVVETGPDAGTERVVSGTLTGISYQDGAGTVMLNITGLKVGLPVFLAMLARGDAAAAWAMVTTAPNLVLGANDASGPGHSGTGDVIATGILADDVRAAAGDDFIKDQGGDDLYDGGTGFDTLSYEGWFYQPWLVTRGLSADLALGSVIGPDGKTDTVTGIEAITGTFRIDQIKGDGLGNKFSGLGGADKIDGRGGFDIISFTGDAGQGGTDGVRINLAQGTARDGFGSRDAIVSIEGAEGSAQADTFNDNGANNWFDGQAGDDTLRFSGGNDTGHGGDGSDLFVFRGLAYDDDTIDDFDPTEGDRIQFDAATSFAQLHLANVAGGVNVQFGSGSVTLLGLTLAQLQASDFGF